jgi:glutamyl-tRNA reductase
MMAKTPDIALFSFSHHDTSIEDRDALAFSPEDVEVFVPRVSGELGGEVAVLSTCNRTEFYLFGEGDKADWTHILPHVLERKELDLSALERPRALKGTEAARHLFRVAASMESLALGEDQILAQVKSVHEQIVGNSGKSPVLDRLYQFAIRAGKRVRTETSLCDGAVSISSAAVDLSRRIFGDLADNTILLVGAGETSESAAENFRASGATRFLVANRGKERGQALADRFQGRYVPLDELSTALEKADIAVFATGATDYLVTKSDLKRIMRKRKNRSLFLIDISNPRNVEPSCANVSSTFLYNIDDLESVVRENLDQRKAEIPHAERIIEEMVAEWEAWMNQMRVRPTIAALSKRLMGIREQELERYRGKVSDEHLADLEAMSKSLMKKVMHNPIMHMRSSLEDGTLRPEDLDLIWSLFNLDDLEDNS